MDLEMPITGVPRMGRERVRYVPNRRSFGAFMRSEQMRDVTAEAASDIAIEAAARTPESGDGERHTGLHARVKSGFKVKREAGQMKVGGNFRVRVDVENDEDGSPIVEFGGRGMKAQRPLGRAGAKFGDFKPDGGPEA